MNCVRLCQDAYIYRMMRDVGGMKALLLDAETTGILSLLVSQSQILEREVYYVEQIERAGKKEQMQHLKAICFLRPTASNIEFLAKEFRKPRFEEYHLYFSNVLKKSFLEKLAEADENELVKSVLEYFVDYYALQPQLFTLNLKSIRSLEQPGFWNTPALERATDGLASVFLSLKKRPVIMHTQTSVLSRSLADNLRARTGSDSERGLFDFREPVLVLILDRRDDPVTPLLKQWTYQAMVHELLGIHDNRVSLAHLPRVSPELKEVVLSADQDEFFAKTLFYNFGDLGVELKRLVDEFQGRMQSNRSISSIADMQDFVENYPQFRKLSGSVSKHVAIVSELSRLVDNYRLLEVSELEQELASVQDRMNHLHRVQSLIADPAFRSSDKLRLVLLFLLRYEKEAQAHLRALMDPIERTGLATEDCHLPAAVRKHCGEDARSGDLFSNKSFLSVAKSTVTRGIKGVDNVFTQHQPLLYKTLEHLQRGTLQQVDIVCREHVASSHFSDIIIFYTGGVTYAEHEVVHNFCRSNPTTRVLLGGTSVVNSDEFLDSLKGLHR
eukprot:Rmarinus@m.15099